MKQGFTGRREIVTEYPHTFHAVPDDMFPLFLTQVEFLLMLDGTLQNPFWQRNDDGTLAEKVELHEEKNMLDDIPDFCDLLASEDCPEPDSIEQHEEASARICINYSKFVLKIWPKLTSSWSPMQCKQLSAASVFQEIHSYIKGSAAALRSPNGRLTRKDYNGLGKKMAPNFQMSCDGAQEVDRDFVYGLYEQYEEAKKKLNAYDISDVVFHIWRELEKHPDLQRTPIHSMLVDETQDFTQSQLALFIRITEDKCVCEGGRERTRFRGECVRALVCFRAVCAYVACTLM